MAALGSIAGGIGAIAMASNPLGWIAGGAAILSGILGGFGEQEQSRAMIASINEQEKSLMKQKEQVGLASEARTDITLGQAYEKQEALGFNIGSQFEQFYRQQESISSQTGLFDPSKQVAGKKRVQGQYDIAAQGLQSQLGESLAEIDIWREGQESTIENQLRMLDQQRAQYEQQGSFMGAFLG